MRAAAAILAGGRARRLGGVHKGLLAVGGRPIVARQLATLAPLCDERLLVAGDLQPYAGVDARLVRDRAPGRGPLAGLETALDATRCGALLLFGCDLPFLDGGLVQLVRDAAPSAQAVVPRVAGRAQPLHARFAVAVLPQVRARLARGALRLVELLDDLDVYYLEEPALRAIDPTLVGLTNVNTPEDLAAADARAAREEFPHK